MISRALAVIGGVAVLFALAANTKVLSDVGTIAHDMLAMFK